MKRRRTAGLLFLMTLWALAEDGLAGSYGEFIGTVKTEWLPDGRRMKLLEEFAFVEPLGKKWTAPKGWVIDGASIPRVAWTVAGGPFEGKYRAASVIHDVGCDQRTETWQDVHEVFFLGMMASGVEPWRAKIMYAAVYHFGPRWPAIQFVPNVTPEDFKSIKQRVLKEGDFPPGTIFEVEQIQEASAPHADLPAQIQDNVDLLVKLNPPRSGLSEEDFGLLEEKIKSSPEEWTLERIENYKPKNID